ncbi:hypothetical protein ACIP4Y_28475 [Streptomyces sp. NPDC088810]|uniref:hypothetical protein n=1 Tax=unclassified Streptomyces TaxID=2593676 RepID=UPI00382B83C6
MAGTLEAGGEYGQADVVAHEPNARRCHVGFVDQAAPYTPEAGDRMGARVAVANRGRGRPGPTPAW